MMIDTELLRRRVERLDGLPTLPSVASSLVEMTQSPKTSATEIGELISRDQALTGRVLRMVNSAYYGFPKQISTVNHAVVILGFSRVKNMVLAASVFGLRGDAMAARFNAPDFWRHSLGAAVAARCLSRASGRGEPEESFVCGLLHDIGKLVLAQVAREDYDRCLEMADQRHCLLRSAENEILGLDHSEVGSWLAAQWKLPAGVQAAIRHHHEPNSARKDRDSVSMAHLGDILARALHVGSGGDLSIPAIDDTLSRELGLTPATLDSLVMGFAGELERAKDFFDMIGG
jgi:HD-like signal output (HDOD) protein